MRRPKSSASKTQRFKPRSAAQVPALQLVVYELISLLRESAEPQVRERLISLQARIQIIADETSVAQDCAEMDGEEVDDGTLP